MACRCHEGDIFVPWLTCNASVACSSDDCGTWRERREDARLAQSLGTLRVSAQSSLRRLRIRLTYSRTAEEWARADPPGTTLPNSDVIDGPSWRARETLIKLSAFHNRSS